MGGKNKITSIIKENKQRKKFTNMMPLPLIIKIM